MRKHDRIGLAIALIFMAIGFCGSSSAQRTATIVGNKVVYFPPVGQAQPITEAPLPIPNKDKYLNIPNSFNSTIGAAYSSL
jgi:hypothetical protein